MTKPRLDFEVRYEEATAGAPVGNQVCLTRCETFAEALVAMNDCRHCAHILHVPSDLELHKIDDSFIWIDAQGRERPSPIAFRQ